MYIYTQNSNCIIHKLAMDTLQRGVQWEEGAVDGGSTT